MRPADSRRGCLFMAVDRKSSTHPQNDAPDPERTWRTRLLDHLVSSAEQQQRDGEAERLGGLHVDDQLELCWLLDGQIGWLDALEDLVDITGHLPVNILPIISVAQKATGR